MYLYIFAYNEVTANRETIRSLISKHGLKRFEDYLHFSAIAVTRKQAMAFQTDLVQNRFNYVVIRENK